MSTVPADRETATAPDAATAENERAVAALQSVERELERLRDQRHRLDVVEARMWKRRNLLEDYLIGAMGADWWRARRTREASRRAPRHRAARRP